MQNIGLSASEQRAFHAALADTHSIRVGVSVLNTAGDHLATVSSSLLDGQVNVDNTAAVTRNASITLLDPDRSLHLDSNSPAAGALYLDRMLRISYGVKVTALSDWVDVPVFTGPVTSLSRSDDVLSVEAQGKEALALGAFRYTTSYKKGHSKTGVIRSMMNNVAGETRLDIPDLSPRLNSELGISREAQPWVEAQKLAQSIDRQLFYDGRGICRLRRPPDNPLFTFRTGTGGTVVGPPQLAYTIEALANVVIVRGGKPRGVKTDDDPDTNAPKSVPGIRYTATAHRSHPMSPQRLGRNGVPLYLQLVVENDQVRSTGEAKRLARRTLSNKLMQALDVSFDALVVPHLDPGDLVRLVSEDKFDDRGRGDVNMEFRLQQFSIPLSTAAAMTVGYHRNLSPKRRGNN